ncbi:MAG: PRC-barrel domain-containing protein [Candidatus Micrarchaeaceae archaeon]
MKVSDLYHMDIYSDAGQYIGDVQGVILDLEAGEVSRLLTVSWKNVKGDVKSVLKDKSILYKNVKNVGDVVLVSSPRQFAQEPATKEEINDLTK